MAAEYPQAIPTFPIPTPDDRLGDPLDGGAYVDHTEYEKKQSSEIVALATELGTGLKGSLSNLSERINVEINADGTLKTEFLKVDQTTPQTIINGIPLLAATNGDFNDIYHIVNKQYVDNRVSGTGGFVGNVFFRTDNSDVIGYKRVDYTAETSETELSAVVNASEGEKLIRTYIYDGELLTNTLDAGVYTVVFTYKVNNAQGTTQLGFEVFVRTTGGVETNLFRFYCNDLNDLSYVTIKAESSQPQFSCNSTDRFGVRIYAKTTRVSDVTINTIVGGVRASYFTTPLPFRHSLLRGRELPNQHPIRAIQYPPVNVTSTPYEVSSTDGLLLVNSASDIVINLPTATASGRMVVIKNIGSGTVTLDANASELIDDETTQELYQFDAVQLVDAVSGYWVVI